VEPEQRAPGRPPADSAHRRAVRACAGAGPGPAISGALGLGSTGLLITIGLVFLVAGVASDGNGISSNTYLLEIVPEDERPTYIGLANTTLSVVTFLPVLGGWLVANVGYSATVGIGVTFALLGLGASLRLREVGGTLRRSGA
jgi:MFS family permease